MDDYYEMEAEQRNNSRRLKQMGRKRPGRICLFLMREGVLSQAG